MADLARDREREGDRRLKESAALTAFLMGGGKKNQSFQAYLKELGLQPDDEPKQQMRRHLTPEEIRAKAGKIREADRRQQNAKTI